MSTSWEAEKQLERIANAMERIAGALEGERPPEPTRMNLFHWIVDTLKGPHG